MYFGTKNYLKNKHYYTTEHTVKRMAGTWEMCIISSQILPSQVRLRGS